MADKYNVHFSCGFRLLKKAKRLYDKKDCGRPLHKWSTKEKCGKFCLIEAENLIIASYYQVFQRKSDEI